MIHFFVHFLYSKSRKIPLRCDVGGVVSAYPAFIERLLFGVWTNAIFILHTVAYDLTNHYIWDKKPFCPNSNLILHLLSGIWPDTSDAPIPRNLQREQTKGRKWLAASKRENTAREADEEEPTCISGRPKNLPHSLYTV